MNRGTDTAGHLLFGLLALQTGLINQAALVAAFHAWTVDKARPLADHLIALGHLDAAHRPLLEGLAEAHLARHGGDVERSLAAVAAGRSARESLARLGDPDIEGPPACVGSASTEHDGDSDSDRTATYTVGTATSDGQRFRVLRPHARGGLGAVFVALDSELHREVAIKQILDEHADDTAIRHRFLLEAEITAGLEHPGIVPVYGLGSYADGRPYYAMRFIHGDSLKEAIERFHTDEACKSDPGRRSLELGKLLRRFVDVCNAIDYAHSRGILHRDIKPGNIIVGRHGETLMVDWGLAKATGKAGPGAEERTLMPCSASGSSETLPGMALGTPAYMSPEQAVGDLDRLGPSSDVYSLGATLYYLLTGKPPQEGEDIGELLRKVQRGDFPRPRQIDATIDPALEAVCLKAMALRIEDRYASPRALVDDIERWMVDEPVSAYHEPWPRRATRWVRRHRPLVAASAALLVTAVLALATGTVLILREKDRTEARRKEAVEQAESLRRQLYVNRVNLAQREWSAGNLVQAERLLGDCPEDLRDWEWSYCQRLCHLERLDRRGHGIDVWSVAFSPDGRRVASGAGMFVYTDEVGRGELAVWDAATGRDVFSHRGLGFGVQGVAFSPDGTKLATAGAMRLGGYQGELTLWDAATGGRLFLKPEPGVNALCVAFSPDGRQIGAGYGVFNATGGGGYFKLHDAETGAERLKLPVPAAGVSAVAFSPDGRRVALAGSGAVGVWDLEARAKAVELLGHSQWVYAVAFSPDGAKIATGGWDNTVRLWDAATGRQVRAFEGHSSFVRGVAFSPDGARIVSGGEDRSVKLWDAATGRELATFHGHTGFVNSVAFSRDGTRFASAGMDGTVKVWDPDAGPYRTFAGHNGFVTGVAFGPGGRRVASVSGGNFGDHVLKVWDPETGRQVSEIPGDIGRFSGVAFNSDGTRLAAVTRDNAVRFWDAATGRESAALRGHTATIRGFSLSPDARSAATASDDGSVRLWDAITGQPVRVLERQTGGVIPPRHILYPVAFSPDGRLLASGAAEEVRLWEVATGRLIRTLKGHTDRVQCLAFSPDGRLLASGDGLDVKTPGVVKLWDSTTGREVHSLRGHAGCVFAVAFHPDGTRLASASEDKTIKLWDPATGQEVLTLSGHASGILCLAFSPDGRRIASGGVDWTVRLWDATPLTPAHP
jgi:WD40 repeat protein/serine/threonine protein kinase